MSAVQAPGTTALLMRLAKVAFRHSDEERLGMRPRWYVTLSFLSDHDGASQQALGEALCVDANNLLLLLNELESAEYAERRRDPLDRRRHLVHLTAKGRRALDRAERAQEAVEVEVLAALEPDERATLRELLARALDKAGPGSG
jgi:MarR family transcriptional regulator, temperature-dependent positive regulator of motility